MLASRRSPGRRTRLAALVLLTTGTLAAGSAAPGDAAVLKPVPWSGWVTGPAAADRKLATVAPVTADADVTVAVDTADRRQVWTGTGASFTDSSVDLLTGRTAALRLLFDPRSTTGARLSWARLPLSATDFSSRGWTFTWDPKGRKLTDTPEMRRALSVLWTAKAYRRDLKLVATPWTAPATMKTSRALNYGGLDPAFESQYADMLIAQVDYLKARLGSSSASGVPLQAITFVNEPGYESYSYPTMSLTDAQMVSLAQRMATKMRARKVQMWAVDHNWNDRGRVDTVLAGAPKLFAAAAFHCYGGTTSEMQGLTVPAVVTECTGSQADDPAGTFAYDSQVLVHNSIAAGATGLFMWNLALDPSGGPKAAGGCQACRGLLEIDPATGAVTPQPEFWTLAQLNRAAEAGAVVLGTSVTSSNGVASSAAVVAFRNPDGSVGVFGHNPTGQTVTVAVTTSSAERRFSVGPGELFTLRGRP